MKTSFIVKAELFRSKGLLITVGLILALAFSLSAATMMTERMIKEFNYRSEKQSDSFAVWDCLPAGRIIADGSG